MLPTEPALATALAWLASVFAAVVVFALVCAVVVIVTRLLDDGGPFHATLDEIKNGERNAGPPRDSLTVEADPIESYQGAVRPMPFLVAPDSCGGFPRLINPLTNSRERSSEIVS